MIHVGFEFPGSTPAHLILSFPDESEDAAVFEEHGHHVELGDQRFGRDSGVMCAWVHDTRHFDLLLNFDAGIEGRKISVSLDEPMPAEVMALMAELPAPVA